MKEFVINQKGKDMQPDECCICYEAFSGTIDYMVLECGHKFHCHCVFAHVSFVHRTQQQQLRIQCPYCSAVFVNQLGIPPAAAPVPAREPAINHAMSGYFLMLVAMTAGDIFRPEPISPWDLFWNVGCRAMATAILFSFLQFILALLP